jgi:hypothetical protein
LLKKMGLAQILPSSRFGRFMKKYFSWAVGGRVKLPYVWMKNPRNEKETYIWEILVKR